MSDPLSRYIEAATGLTHLTKSKAEQVVHSLLQQGTAVTGSAQEIVDGLLERSQENRDALLALVRGETRRVVKAMGLASSNDVERLQRQVVELRRRLGEPGAKSTEGASGGTPAKKAAKKTAAKKTARKAGKKGGAKKSSKPSSKTSSKKSAS